MSLDNFPISHNSWGITNEMRLRELLSPPCQKQRQGRFIFKYFFVYHSRFLGDVITSTNLQGVSRPSICSGPAYKGPRQVCQGTTTDLSSAWSSSHQGGPSGEQPPPRLAFWAGNGHQPAETKEICLESIEVLQCTFAQWFPARVLRCPPRGSAVDSFVAQ